MTESRLHLQGRALVLGDNIDTDMLAPGYAMRKPIDELSRHCLEAIDPAFARSVRRGDVLVAGDGFGIGSSREQAVEALIFLGISAVVARSVARIFYRNALNLGLPVIRFGHPHLIGKLDQVSIDLEASVLRNLSTGMQFSFEPIPPFLLEMLLDGGLLPHLHKRLSAAASSHD
jgi:3-isopropylmalate/(R)-2-methylmalate dehydratase small subunit